MPSPAMTAIRYGFKMVLSYLYLLAAGKPACQTRRHP